MKKLAIVFLTVILGTVSMFATTPKEMPLKEKLRIEIGRIMEHSKFLTEEAVLTARVDFVLNNKGEIVVLQIESNNLKLKTFIKNELNYQPVVALGKNNISFKRFSIPVKVINNN